MKTKVCIALMLLTGFTVAGLAQEKQHRFGVEFNAGGSMAVSKPAGTSLKPGFGFEGAFHYTSLKYNLKYPRKKIALTLDNN